MKNIILLEIDGKQKKWILVADKMECDDPDGKFNIAHPEEEGLKTVDDCANVCRGISSMFAFGTNDFGEDRCNEKGCRCLCEISASQDGSCTQVNHDGYRLYKVLNLDMTGNQIEY